MLSVFPARAGMSPQDRTAHHLLRRFPRASGDEPIKRAMQADLEQFSPRERG